MRGLLMDRSAPSPYPLSHFWRRGQGEGDTHLDRRASSRGGLDGEVSLNQPDPLFDAGQPEPRAARWGMVSRPRPSAGRLKTDALILDAQHQFRAICNEGDPRFVYSRVLGDVA